jgi:hypothetical protein
MPIYPVLLDFLVRRVPRDVLASRLVLWGWVAIGWQNSGREALERWAEHVEAIAN